MTDPVGLIAGSGRLPLEIARAARRRGCSVAAVAIRDFSDRDLEREVERVRWVRLGELQTALDFLRSCGVTGAVLAGKVAKSNLFRAADDLRPDARAASLLASLPDLSDASIFAAFAAALEEEGIRVEPQAQLVPHLLVDEGLLGRVHPTPEEWSDIGFGWPIAKAIAGLDIGQTVVVHGRVVLALEAIEGTDAAVARAGKLGGPGLCIVKVAKPDQDPRFDLPTIGLETIQSAAAAGAAVLAFEARQTLVLDRPGLVDKADALGIALVAVGAGGPDAALCRHLGVPVRGAPGARVGSR
jgi:DUF1009 family protein